MHGPLNVKFINITVNISFSSSGCIRDIRRNTGWDRGFTCAGILKAGWSTISRRVNF